LAEIELERADLNGLADIIENLVRDTPQTMVAAARFRRMLAKASPIAVDGFRTILVNVITEAAKRAMFPGP
jgi:hypothetical protein